MEIKKIAIAEFRKLGYLQELNRQFLHPLGLALEIVVEDDGVERLGGVWDCRGDPEGFLYDEFDSEKAKSIEEIQRKRARCRFGLFGFVIQPIGLKWPGESLSAGIGWPQTATKGTYGSDLWISTW